MKLSTHLKTLLAIFFLLGGGYLLYTIQSRPASTVITSDEIEDILLHIHDKDALVIFDIDNTLITPEDMQASDPWFSQEMDTLIQQGYTPQQAVKKILPEHLEAHSTSTFYPVETGDTRAVVNALHEANIQVLAITARSGDFSTLTYEQLDATNILLTPEDMKWPRICYIFRDLDPPVYYTPGILSVAGGDKGQALQTFLEHLEYLPSQVIIIDDRLKNIEKVQAAVRNMNIPFTGLHYTRVKTNPERGYAVEQHAA